MTHHSALRRLSLVALVMASFVWLGAVKADVDPSAASFLNLKDVKWKENADGSAASYLVSGDPRKEGSIYVADVAESLSGLDRGSRCIQKFVRV